MLYVTVIAGFRLRWRLARVFGGWQSGVVTPFEFTP